ncbi:MAG: DUF4199 domain-containing protein [Flavobacteriales bacterium]|nr:DUF4199 domain-containing protein [Flavobacteriales bacterium]
METLDQNILANPRKPLMPNALRYGAIIGFIVIIEALLFYTMKMDQTGWLVGLIGWLTHIVAIFIVLRHYRDKVNGGFMAYGQGVGLATLTGLVVGIIGAIWMVIYMKFINTGFALAIEEKAIEDMQSQGMSDSEMEMAMSMASFFWSPAFIALASLLGSVLMYLILGLIASAFIKKD